MKIPAGTHVARCRSCRRVVGVARDNVLPYYRLMWRHAGHDVERVEAETEVKGGHGSLCPHLPEVMKEMP